MCIALPMKIVALEEMKARCERKGEELTVDISMIEPPQSGDWLLVFQNRAIRAIDEAEAHEIEAALTATALAMAGEADEEAIHAGFGDLMDREPELPEHLRRLVPGGK